MPATISPATTTRTTDRAAASPAPGPLLFQPLRLGALELPHRIIMAPLTRSRAGQPGNRPTPLMACYYAQRASAALIISEATQVSMQGQGYAWTPGIHSREQIAGWQVVTDKVHEAGGRIFLQMWHVGRISHPTLQPDNMLPVGPSAVKPAGNAFIENDRGEGAFVPFVEPRALQIEEMPYLVQQYVRGARNAQKAGFDGVEIHSANGYLLEQFIDSGSNRRTDEYGGSIENRARLLLEVVEAVTPVWGADRVGVRLSPMSTFNDVHDDEPEATFGWIADRLSDYGLAYLHIVNPGMAQMEKGQAPEAHALGMVETIREKYRGNLIVAGGFDVESAEHWLAQKRADAIVFGRKFLANPDLPERLRENSPLNPPDPPTFYGGGAKGYTDYPSLAQEKGEAPRPCVDESWR